MTAETMAKDETKDATDPTEAGKPPAPTTHLKLLSWVEEVARLTQPDSVHWCTGSNEEWTSLTDALVELGTLRRLDPAKKPNSFWCASDRSDVARVEDRTFICSDNEADAGATNNWVDPDEMKRTMSALYAGCMQGRTMYVIPFAMGHLGADKPMFGVEITDSAYVAVSMRIMARMGSDVLRAMEERNAEFVRGLHSVGAPLAPGQTGSHWPSNPTKFISHFPEERTIWSFGSG